VKKQKTFDQAFEGAKRMSDRYVAKGPYKFYSDSDIVEDVQKGLANNELKHGYRYCP
jgi:ferredoxin-thioredoxin reductase catalytic subunit